MVVIVVPDNYVWAANEALRCQLDQALLDHDWDAVESLSKALYDFARTFTKPSGPNS